MPSPHLSYEEAFSNYLGKDTYVYSFWKGRVALYAILKALGIGPGDEVILPGYTCVVVPNAIRLLGAKPVYVDNQLNTFNMDPDETKTAITSRTRAIIAQHTYGIPAPVMEIKRIAEPYELPVIEDCAHTIGSTIDDQKVGLLGDAAFFSSQWSKPYTTGLGGVAVTCNPDLAARIENVYKDYKLPPAFTQRKLWIQYQIYQYLFTPKIYWQAQSILRVLSKFGLFVGSSNQAELNGEDPKDHQWKMSVFQQKWGSYKLESYYRDMANNQLLAQLYDTELARMGWSISNRSKQTVLLRYPVRVAEKINTLKAAQKERIEIGSWFETPLHPIPLNKHSLFGYQLGQCPNAEYAAEHVINLPLHNRITPTEAYRIIEFLDKFVEPIK